jgi:AraC-like DNA-binding protein
MAETIHALPITKHDKVIPGYRFVCAVLAIAQPRGVSVHKLLRGTGIFDDALTPSMRVSGKQLIALIENVQSYCKAKDASFLIGKHLANTLLSHEFSSIKESGSLGQMIQVVSTQRWLCLPLVSFARYEVNENALWVARDTMGCSKAWAFAIQISFSMLVALAKACSKTRLPLHFGMTTPRPRNIEDFETYLGLRLNFDAPFMSLMLPNGRVLAPLGCSSGEGVAQSRGQFAPLTSPDATLSILDKVRLLSEHNLHASLPEVAAGFSMSAATFKRKLKEHEYSYRELIEEVRREQAIVLLAMKKLNNEQSASQMAFSDLTNFRRAVKRLTGHTPSELRAL